MPIWKKYTLAETVEDALAALKVAGEPSRLIAGGTDLLLDLQQGRHPPVDTLVDITRVPEMNRLEVACPSGTAGKVLYIGAAVPLSRVADSDLVARHARALADATVLIGGPQVRNVATLGGNVAHALPAADGAIALLALDAQALVANSSGRVLKPLIDLYAGPGRSTLEPRRDLLVGFQLPLVGPGAGSAFARIMRPQGVALPVLNMAVWLVRRSDTIEEIRLSIGPAGQVPARAFKLEAYLQGKSLQSSHLDEAWRLLLDSVRFRTSPRRATADYRQQLSRVLLDEVLATAWQRAVEAV